MRADGRMRIARVVVSVVPIAVLVGFLLWFGTAQGRNRYWMQIGVEAMWVAAAAIGLNVLLGYTGLLSLGHWAFFIVGGFVGAIWTVEDWGLNPWLGFPVAFVVGMALGALLALTCCHLRGFYLTVVTLAFGILVSSVALLLDSQFNGLSGRPVTKPLDTEFSFISSTNPNRYLVGLYWIGVGMLLVCLYMVWNLVHSRWGRVYKAIREAELAAGASGVPTYYVQGVGVCVVGRHGVARRRARRADHTASADGRRHCGRRPVVPTRHRRRRRRARNARGADRRRLRVHARTRRRHRR